MYKLKTLSKIHVAYLKENGLDPEEFLFERTTIDDYVFYNIKNKTLWAMRI